MTACVVQLKARIDARNSLETYCYNMKSTISDKLGDKLSEDDKEKVRCTSLMHADVSVLRLLCMSSMGTLLLFLSTSVV